MIKDQDELIYIQDENGKEVPFKILKEFDNEEGDRHFIFYIGLEEDAEEVFVGECVKNAQGEDELVEIDSDEDMKFIEEVFDEFLNELDAEDLDEEDEEEDEE